MTFERVTRRGDIAAAARLSAQAHERLRSRLPFLNPRSEGDFAPRVDWVVREGLVVGAFTSGVLTAFLGAFPIADYRAAGQGCFGPEWCHGAVPEVELSRTYRDLYRALAPHLISRGCAIHAFSVYASESEVVSAMELTGFGRIVMNAARPTAELLAELTTGRADVQIDRARTVDAPELSRLDAALANHLAASPVLMPNAGGRDIAAWQKWLEPPGHVAFLARRAGRSLGFIKAQEPQQDVSYAVHGDSTMAINGMYVDADVRCRGIGRRLLATLVREAAATGKEIVSVDCETTNPEAYGFWSQWFAPVAWGLERRVQSR